MKYVIFDLDGKKIGSYEGELDETSNTRSYLLCPPLAIHKELPDGMDEDCVALIGDDVVVDNVLVTAKAVKVKAVAEQVLYDQMNADVLNQMAAVFGTLNTASAAAFKDTWQLMLDKPSLFAGKLGFTDNASVTTFATAKMASAEAYAVYRMERIAQFQADKAAL